MGGYLSTYSSSSSEQNAGTSKTVVIEPSKPKEVIEKVEEKKNTTAQSDVKDLTTQIIEEHVQNTNEVVSQIIEAPLVAEPAPAPVQEVKQEESVKQEEEQVKQEQVQEPGKKIEIDPVEVNKSADVVKKNKKKKNKH
jgi:hypothetical protein